MAITNAELRITNEGNKAIINKQQINDKVLGFDFNSSFVIRNS
jgi:hypothetical protein